MKSIIKTEPTDRKSGKYKEKLSRLKRQIREYVHVSYLTYKMNLLINMFIIRFIRKMRLCWMKLKKYK